MDFNLLFQKHSGIKEFSAQGYLARTPTLECMASRATELFTWACGHRSRNRSNSEVLQAGSRILVALTQFPFGYAASIRRNTRGTEVRTSTLRCRLAFCMWASV